MILKYEKDYFARNGEICKGMSLSQQDLPEMNAQSLEKLVLMKMPYGKHAGRALAGLPGNYLAWFAREGFPKGELGELLELMHTLDHNGLRGLLNPIAKAHGLQRKF